MFLGAFADEIEIFALAMRANARRSFAVIAVMAEEFVISAMKCQRDVAIFAFHRLAARAAQHELRKAAAV